MAFPVDAETLDRLQKCVEETNQHVLDAFRSHSDSFTEHFKSIVPPIESLPKHRHHTEEDEEQEIYEDQNVLPLWAQSLVNKHKTVHLGYTKSLLHYPNLARRFNISVLCRIPLKDIENQKEFIHVIPTEKWKSKVIVCQEPLHKHAFALLGVNCKTEFQNTYINNEIDMQINVGDKDVTSEEKHLSVQQGSINRAHILLAGAHGQTKDVNVFKAPLTANIASFDLYYERNCQWPVTSKYLHIDLPAVSKDERTDMVNVLLDAPIKEICYSPTSYFVLNMYKKYASNDTTEQLANSMQDGNLLVVPQLAYKAIDSVLFPVDNAHAKGCCEERACVVDGDIKVKFTLMHHDHWKEEARQRIQDNHMPDIIVKVDLSLYGVVLGGKYVPHRKSTD